MRLRSTLSFRRSGVSGLLRAGCPSAIRGFVIPVNINSVKASAFGARSHVGKEIRKRANPAVADNYASATVITKALRVWIEAAFAHHRVRAIFRTFSATVLQITPASFCCSLAMKATARNGVPIRKMTGLNAFFISAIAAAKPAGASSGFSRRYNCQPAKPKLGNIKFSRHRVNIMVGSRGVSP